VFENPQDPGSLFAIAKSEDAAGFIEENGIESLAATPAAIIHRRVWPARCARTKSILEKQIINSIDYHFRGFFFAALRLLP
jgi:hypothetical protein